MRTFSQFRRAPDRWGCRPQFYLSGAAALLVGLAWAVL